MPKYLFEASYTAEGLHGLVKDTPSGRKAAVQKAFKSLGGKVEVFYFSFGDSDAVIVADLPDNASAAAVSLSVASSGLVHLRTTPLLTVEEADKAAKMKSKYRAPGSE
jgi:uncharacterized protein with GYD domain